MMDGDAGEGRMSSSLLLHGPQMVIKIMLRLAMERYALAFVGLAQLDADEDRAVQPLPMLRSAAATS